MRWGIRAPIWYMFWAHTSLSLPLNGISIRLAVLQGSAQRSADRHIPRYVCSSSRISWHCAMRAEMYEIVYRTIDRMTETYVGRVGALTANKCIIVRKDT